MLPPITSNKELCSSPVNGRQEDSIVNSFVISRVDYCNSLLAGVSTRPAAVCDERSSTINRRHQEAGSYQARVARPLPLASRPTARPVQAVSADIQGSAWTGTVVHRWPVDQFTSIGSRQRLRSATRGDLVICSSVTHFGTVHLLWPVPRPVGNCRCTYEHGIQLARSRQH